MSSDLAHRLYNTRERATSTDQNRSIQLSDRNTALAVWYAAQNDETLSGVLTGLRVTISGDTVTVGPGLGLFNDGVAAYPDSPYRWMEVPEGTSLSLGIGDDKVSGEWMVIEIEPGFDTTITTDVDVFDPTTGAFASTSLPKEVQSLPVLSVRSSGTANQFPGGLTGKMPLAYIYDDGGALNNSNVVWCRPLLRSKAPMDSGDIFADNPSSHLNQQLIQGGGIYVTADGTTVNAHALTGRFYNSRDTFSISRGVAFDLSDANAWDGGTVATGEESVYLYALPAPYPSGYDSLATREFIVGSDVIAQFSTMNAGVISQAQTGCIVVASTTAPDSLETGVQGPTFSTKTITDVPFRNGGGSVSVTTPVEVYMGAVDWATSEAKEQVFVPGTCRVIPQSRTVENRILALGAAATFHPFNVREGDGNDPLGDGIMPAHAFEFEAVVSVGAVIAGAYEINLRDDESSEILLMTGTFNKDIWFTEATPSVNLPLHVVQIGASVEMRFATNVTSCTIYTLSYIDSILATR